MRSLSVAVLRGGLSSERAISLASGDAAAKALAARGHRVAEFDPAEVSVAKIPWRQFDVAFLAMHGEYGEDGQLQEQLDRLHVCYTGSGANASRIAFSKSFAKTLFDRAGIPTPRWHLLDRQSPVSAAGDQCAKLGYPVVVKPDRGGSSIGVSLVHDPTELSAALELAFACDDRVILEEAIIGAEWTVGLIDRDPLPLIQIEAASDLFTFDAKYHDAATVHRFDPQIPPLAATRIIAAGQSAAFVVGATGISRVDIRTDRFLRPWVLEVNTIPGLTATSLVPDAARHAGWTLGELCERAIYLALQRRAAA